MALTPADETARKAPASKTSPSTAEPPREPLGIAGGQLVGWAVIGIINVAVIIVRAFNIPAFSPPQDRDMILIEILILNKVANFFWAAFLMSSRAIDVTRLRTLRIGEKLWCRTHKVALSIVHSFFSSKRA